MMQGNLARREALIVGAASLGAASLGACATAASGVTAMNDASRPDLVATAAAIRAGDLTALDAVEAAIARAEQVEPQINAIATAYFDDARAAARTPAAAGPFAGAPTFVKDLADAAGQRTLYGSRAFTTSIAPADDPITAAMRRAGLTSLGKSTTPEFGYTASTEPLVTGPTRNPWSLDHSPGGSSGGAAALVAAGVVPLAHASDGGGSIRIPASCCGLFGLKPSRGRLPARPAEKPIPVEIAVQGCVSRTVRDSAAFFAAVERADGPFAPIGLVQRPLARPLRIGLIVNTATDMAPDPEVADATLEAAALCRALGHEVFETRYTIDGAAFSQAFTLYWAFGAVDDARTAQAAAPDKALEDILEPLSLSLLEVARTAPADALPNAIQTLRDAERAYARMFDAMDVLLTPTLAKPPLRIGELSPTLPFADNQRVVMEYVGYTPLQNVAGAPAMSAPLAWTASGLPIGAHFSAKAGDDALLLALALQLEEAQPWAARRPPVWAADPR